MVWLSSGQDISAHARDITAPVATGDNTQPVDDLKDPQSALPDGIQMRKYNNLMYSRVDESAHSNPCVWLLDVASEDSHYIGRLHRGHPESQKSQLYGKCGHNVWAPKMNIQIGIISRLFL